MESDIHETTPAAVKPLQVWDRAIVCARVVGRG